MIKSSALGLRRIVRYGAIVTVVLTLAGGVVVGAGGLIPDPSGLIHGCYDNATGAMRVVTSATSCAATETPISWNQAGVPGATGPIGLPGIPGPVGAAGPQGAQGSQGNQGPQGNQGNQGDKGAASRSGPARRLGQDPRRQSR